MPRVVEIINHFQAGEVSTLIDGRTDLERFKNSLREGKNVLITPHGAASSRFGTRYVAEVKDSSKEVRLETFDGLDKDYVLEIGDSYFRVFADGDQVMSGASELEYVTPWPEADIWDLSPAMGSLELIMFHPDYNPRRIERTDTEVDDEWQVEDLEWVDGPYNLEYSDVSITPTATTGTNQSVTADLAIFYSDHLGALLRLKQGAGYGYAEITGIESATVTSAVPTVRIDIKEDFTNTDPSDTYRIGAWCTRYGFPRCGAFHEQRLVAGSTKTQPSTIWGSKNPTIDAEDHVVDHTPGADDDDAYSFTFKNVLGIRSMISGEKLFCLAKTGEAVVSPGSDGGVITGSSITIKTGTNYGASEIPALKVAGSVIFLQRAGKKVREYSFSFEEDRWTAPDLTILASHITAEGIKDWAYSQEPSSILWVVRDDGTLLSLSYDRPQGVVAWTKHVTDGEVESVAVTREDTHDRVWLLVKRTINGTDKRYVEYMEEQDLETVDAEDLFYVDCGATQDGVSTTVVTGADHLEGKTVQVLVDGAVHSDCVVSGGGFTLDTATSVVQYGLEFQAAIEPNRLDVGAQDGTSQGRTKRIPKITARFYKTMGAKIGSSDSDVEQLSFRTPSDPMGSPPALFTGDKPIIFPGGYDEDGFIRVEQNLPLPMTVLALIPWVVVED